MFEAPDRIIFDFSAYHLAAGLALSVFAFMMYRKTWPPEGKPIRSLLAILRTLAFLSLVIFIMDPALVSTTVEEEIPLLPILIDVSRSMSIEDHGAGRSRIEAASETALLIASGLDGVDIQIIPFASSIGPEWQGAGVLTAEGEGTDIIKGIELVAGLSPGRALAGIVVLSDGRSTANASRAGRNFPAPVYTIGFGSDEEGIDISLDEVVYDGTAYTGTEASIECVVRIRGDFTGEIVASLIEGDRVLDEVGMEGDGPGEFHPRLRYRPTTEGEKTLTVKVSAIESEMMTDNNSSLVRIDVLKKALRVLLVDRYPDWDMTFLRALGREADRLDIDVVTWRSASGYYALDSGERWDLSSGLSGYDVVVLGDGRDLLDATGIVRIKEFVSSGGGLVMLSSEDSPLGDSALLDSMKDLIPLDADRAPYIRKGEYRAHVPPGPVTDPLAVLMASTGALEIIPPLDAAVEGFKPAAASVVSLVSGEGYPLVASRPYGAGMVTAVTVFPLWRWNLVGPEGRIAYRTLMTSILEQAAGEMDRAPISVQPGRPVYRSGERIGISIFTRGQMEISRMRGEVFRLEDSDTVPSITFLPSPRQGGSEAWQANLEPMVHGEYKVRISALGAGGERYQGEAGLTVDPVSIEFLATSRDLASLRRIAGMSGGSLIDEDRVDELIGKVDTSPKTITRRDIRPSRSNIFLFLSTVLLLSAEWGLRKVRGMI